MTKEEVKDFLLEQGFKPIQNRELDAVLPLNKSVLLINVTVKDENLKGQIDGKKVLKFPNDRYELILRVKDKVISTKTGFNLDSLESDVEAFKELDTNL